MKTRMAARAKRADRKMRARRPDGFLTLVLSEGCIGRV